MTFQELGLLSFMTFQDLHAWSTLDRCRILAFVPHSVTLARVLSRISDSKLEPWTQPSFQNLQIMQQANYSRPLRSVHNTNAFIVFNYIAKQHQSASLHNVYAAYAMFLLF